MPRAYSADIRGRVIARVESGASRREAAEHFEISASTAIKWVKCFRDTGSCAAKPRGASTSPLEEHADCLLTLVADQPDLTLDEVVSAMHKRGIAGSRSAVWRFFQRHKVTFKKKACGRPSRSEPTWLGHAGAGYESRVRLIRLGWCSSTRPLPIPKWCG